MNREFYNNYDENVGDDDDVADFPAMNIIIPLGGKGERFSKEGYTLPKALIPICGKPMIATVIDNLTMHPADNLIIIYNPSLDEYHFKEYIQSKYPTAILVRLETQTSGAAESVYIGTSAVMQQVPPEKLHRKTLLLDCDTIYTCDIIAAFRKSTDGAVFYTEKRDEPPIYSYISINETTREIRDIAEKRKISNYANTGAYAFMNICELNQFCRYILENPTTYINEPYTSYVIKEMMTAGHTFIGHKLDAECVFSVGTPRELCAHLEKKHAFLFDLDGTLVLTEDIYFEVWHQILKKYEIDLSREIFAKYIQGNSDHYVLNSLLPDVSIDLKMISENKDELFLKNIDKIGVVDGVLNLFENIRVKGHASCIVTNCNRKVAEAIINYVGLSKYIPFIVCAGDCSLGKPFPDPYLLAMEKMGLPKNRSFIFEDSKTGILSGKSAQPKCLIGIETIYNHDELLNSGVNISLKNYVGHDIQSWIDYNGLTTEKLVGFIRQSLDFECSTVHIDCDKLKGGYIADVIKVTITKLDGEVLNCVLKLENPNITSLSEMATRLQLYEREYYFYESVTKFVKTIKMPKCIGLVKNDDLHTVGVLLENLYCSGNYVPNLNLNVENIDVSLKIIDRMAKMHAGLWNRQLSVGFPRLKSAVDATFRPFCYEYICSKWGAFVTKWEKVLTPRQLEIGLHVKTDFMDIQERLSRSNVTLVHGDIKSPNIFYDVDNGNEPVFLDWQHCIIGKGAQDLAFFIIESFDMEKMGLFFPIFKNYYYSKLMEYGVKNYGFAEYEKDLADAFCYIPFFTAVWFGTVSYDELIDKNFPFFFIQKLFRLLGDIYRV